MTDAQTQTVVRLERTYDASPADVRRALTDPDLLAKWFAPGDMRCTVRTLDVRPGGQYEITMHGEEGDHTATGTFDVVEEDRLRMRWNWSEDPLPAPTTLTLTIEPAATGTKLTLLHEGFPDAEAAAMHEQGWMGCLANLDRVL